MAAASAPRGHEGVDVKESTMRWISTGVAGVMWGAVVTTAAVIQPHIQVYQTIWLATLISSSVAIALWITRPDHGRLAHLRLSTTLLRLEKAIREEAIAESKDEQERNNGRLKSVV